MNRFNKGEIRPLKRRKNKSQYTKQITLALVSVICLALNYISVFIAKRNPDFIEFTYSRKIYKGISNALTIINRQLAFSLSEVTYMLTIIGCILLLLYAFKELVFKRYSKALTSLLMIIFIVCFNILYYQLTWGLNNYRYNVETLFELNNTEIDVEDLAESYKYLVEQSNKYKSLSLLNKEVSVNEVLDHTYIGYQGLNAKYAFISGLKSRVKPLIISPLFSASGYTGIYLPLFSEANINKMPHMSGLGFTASHELAHQKGFASEDEANFIGFLACINQDDPYFKYSGYQAMMVYIGNSLYENDKDLYMEISKLRSDEVLSDIVLRREFWDTHIKEKTSEVHNEINDAFLKANNQPDGIVNYSKVTELFVKAYKKGLFSQSKI